MAEKKDKNWIAKALPKSSRGKLHRELHVKEGTKIPAKKLKSAEHSDNPKERRRANLAHTLKGLSHPGRDKKKG